jgi:flagellar M-ring protein FliF
MSAINELWNNLRSLWTGLDARRRYGLLAGGGLIVVLMIVFAVGTLRTEYGVLFADLEERDAAAVVEELKRRKVAYRIEEQGTRILVPEHQVHETRLALMSKGAMLSGGVGFEIFDNKDLSMTEYTQRINYQRALQGELARTIMAVPQVKLARVHLVLPEASLFRREKSKPKGSVSLVLKPDARLGAEQVAGIQRLVAAAVPGLDTGMVTVFDQRGVTLSALADADDGAAGASAKLRMKREVEEHLARKVGAVMDRTFGPGQAIVSVDVTLNFDEMKHTQQEVLPVRGAKGDELGIAVRRRQAVNRHGGSGGITAADTNGVNGVGGALNSTTEVEYEFGRRVEEVVTAPGGIRRLSLGVVVPRALGDEQMARVRSLVAMAAGLNEQRGDAIAVHSIDQLLIASAETGAASLAASTASENPQSGLTAGRIAGLPLTWIAGLAGAFLLLAGSGAWLVARWRARRAEELQRRLLEQQREGLLNEIRQWLAADRANQLGTAKG